MKTLHSILSTSKYVLLVIILTLISIGANAEQANLTIETFSWHEHHVGVNILISSEHDAFILGNQNVRIFYNADHLTLSEHNIESHLDENRYSDIMISEHENYNTHLTVNEASYDAVGFLSFNVSLNDDIAGGEKVSMNGKHIYTIHFEKKSDFDPSDITLALPDLTGELATAFVEVAEWIDPITSKPMTLTLTPSLTSSVTSDDMHLSVGPNPTSDYIYILSDKMIVNVNLYSTNGQKVLSKVLDSNEARIDMGGLTEGMYIVEIEDTEGRLYIRPIAKA